MNTLIGRKARKLSVNFVVALMLASLLAGLIPPPLVGSVAPSLAALLPDVPVANAAGTITGTVFNDRNDNGVFDAGEVGINGVFVTVYDGPGQSCQVTTASGGTYSVNTTTCGSLSAGPYRVEFTLPASLSYLQPTAVGASNATTVRFGLSLIHISEPTRPY